jgi:3-(3-hydroxy-phenyl)propionate hydroxylase
VDAGLQKLTWIPDARYEDGFFVGRGGAVGWQIPQPWVTDDTGTRIRLDDVLDGQWAVLHTGAPPAGTKAWTQVGAMVILNTDPTLSHWLHRKKAAAVVVRPDGFIYAAAELGGALPTPPIVTPIKTGVPA